MLLAASDSDTKTVCCQHGGQSSSNPYFAVWRFEPRKSENFFATEYRCWDEDSAISIRNWEFGGSGPTINVGRNLWIDFIAGEEVNRNPGKKVADQLVVVWTLQPSFPIEKNLLKRVASIPSVGELESGHTLR